jgi:ribosomal protein S18 acetylase RimI-like enzyme
VIRVRTARPEDERALRAIDEATWTADVSPAPLPPAGTPFFSERRPAADVLVADVDGVAAGYAVLGRPTTLAAHAHVLEIRGLAVSAACQGRGAGRRLVEASVEEARARGARKLSLRVLGFNDRARQLYESCGFRVEGILRAEFYLGGRFVDDVRMAHALGR